MPLRSADELMQVHGGVVEGCTRNHQCGDATGQCRTALAGQREETTLVVGERR
jgi:hypothetical protein